MNLPDPPRNRLPRSITFHRDTVESIAANLGIRRPWELTNPELKAAVLNASARVASFANRTN